MLSFLFKIYGFTLENDPSAAKFTIIEVHVDFIIV